MQVSLLVVNLILITVISREYGPTIYGEYASSKSLGVLIGTAVVMSLALVATKLRAQNDIDANHVFSNAYYLVSRNLLIGLLLLYPATLLFKRDFSMTALFLVGFVFNELIHISLAYYQANGDFVSSSKQIMLRTLIYGVGAVTIVFSGYSILWVIFYQVVTLVIFFGIAHFSIPSSELK